MREGDRGLRINFDHRVHYISWHFVCQQNAASVRFRGPMLSHREGLVIDLFLVLEGQGQTGEYMYTGTAI